MAVSAVVPEASAVPIASVEADTEVAEAVVDASVVADRASPATGIPAVVTAVPTPIARSPEGSNVGRQNPGSVNPVVSARTPGPIAGRPEVAIAGAERLIVLRDRRRRVTGLHVRRRRPLLLDLLLVLILRSLLLILLRGVDLRRLVLLLILRSGLGLVLILRSLVLCHSREGKAENQCSAERVA